MNVEMSEQTSELFKSLAEFQKEVKQPKKDANNPFFKSKYVPLENVVEVIHEAGSKHGLSEMTYPAHGEEGVGVGVLITHSSGQYIKFPPILLKPQKNDPQGVGAAMTYARRYALSAAFGIASETDDDGNSISGNETKASNKKSTKKQQDELRKLVADYMKKRGVHGEEAQEEMLTWAVKQGGGKELTSMTDAQIQDSIGKMSHMVKVAK